jgi:hypothetical protein
MRSGKGQLRYYTIAKQMQEMLQTDAMKSVRADLKRVQQKALDVLRQSVSGKKSIPVSEWGVVRKVIDGDVAAFWPKLPDGFDAFDRLGEAIEQYPAPVQKALNAYFECRRPRFVSWADYWKTTTEKCLPRLKKLLADNDVVVAVVLCPFVKSNTFVLACLASVLDEGELAKLRVCACHIKSVIAAAKDVEGRKTCAVFIDDASYSGEQLSRFTNLFNDMLWPHATYALVPYVTAFALKASRIKTSQLITGVVEPMPSRRALLSADLLYYDRRGGDSSYLTSVFARAGLYSPSVTVFQHKLADTLSLPNFFHGVPMAGITGELFALRREGLRRMLRTPIDYDDFYRLVQRFHGLLEKKHLRKVCGVRGKPVPRASPLSKRLCDDKKSPRCNIEGKYKKLLGEHVSGLTGKYC